MTKNGGSLSKNGRTREELLDEISRLKSVTKNLVQSRLREEGINIDKVIAYHAEDPKEIEAVLLKQDPNDYEYTSNDFRLLGKFRLNEMFKRCGTVIFNHFDKKTKKKTVFKPSLLATFYELNYPIITIKPTISSTRDNGDLWYYDFRKEMYIQEAEVFFGTMTKSIFTDWFKPQQLPEIFNHIKYETYIDREKFILDSAYIPIQNGIIKIEHKSNFSIILEENTPDLYVSSRIPIKYDPEADCPIFKKFLDEILPNQKREQKWIQEYLGYCLYRSWPHDKVIMLIGEGDNGKSTLLTLFRKLLGIYNTTTIGIYEMCKGRWYTAELYKKLANIDADTSVKDLQITSNFKTATGGDMIKGERKYKDPFYFESFCKHWLSANTIPYCYDDTDAFYRRWFLIQFWEQFPEGDPKRDETILEKMVPELPGIFNWAIDGLKDLIVNKGFTNPQPAKEVKILWNQLSNPVYAFIYSPQVTIDRDGYYDKQEFYDTFIEYCKKNDLPKWTKDKVGKRINHHFDFIKDSYPYDNEKNKQYHAWSGIRPAMEEEQLEHKKELEAAIIFIIKNETSFKSECNVSEIEKQIKILIEGGDTKFKDLFGISEIIERLNMQNVIMLIGNRRRIMRGLRWNKYMTSDKFLFN